VELLLLKGADPDVKDKVSAGNYNFTDPYRLHLYFIIISIDDVYVYLVVHYMLDIIIIHVNHFISILY
jgi:hypothetical protein